MSSRSIEVVPAEIRAAAVPLRLLGRGAAGAHRSGHEQETVAVPEDMLGRGEHYVLRVNGDSMIEEQIRDGDYLVVRHRETAENGDMVVALVDQESATVKKFYREKDGRVTAPAGERGAGAHVLPGGRVQVQGIVMGVMRRYA
jgi:repressor LexA